MQDTDFNQRMLSADEMTDAADLIVRGFIESVNEGRVVDFKAGPSHPLAMAVIDVRVSDVLKGKANDVAYFEYIRGGAELQQLSANLPVDEVLLFLVPATNWDEDTYKFEEPARGLPPGETLYELRTQQALLIDSHGVLQQPLADEPEVQLFAPGTPLQAAERAISARLQKLQ